MVILCRDVVGQVWRHGAVGQMWDTCSGVVLWCCGANVLLWCCGASVALCRRCTGRGEGVCVSVVRRVWESNGVRRRNFGVKV